MSKPETMTAYVEIQVVTECDWDYSTDEGVECELTSCKWNGVEVIKSLNKEQKEQLEQDWIDHSFELARKEYGA